MDIKEILHNFSKKNKFSFDYYAISNNNSILYNYKSRDNQPFLEMKYLINTGRAYNGKNNTIIQYMMYNISKIDKQHMIYTDKKFDELKKMIDEMKQNNPPKYIEYGNTDDMEVSCKSYREVELEKENEELREKVKQLEEKLSFIKSQLC